MSQELLRALNENLVFFESAGQTEDVKAIKKKIAQVEKSMTPAEKSAKKPSGAANQTTADVTTVKEKK